MYTYMYSFLCVRKFEQIMLQVNTSKMIEDIYIYFISIFSNWPMRDVISF